MSLGPDSQAVVVTDGFHRRGSRVVVEICGVEGDSHLPEETSHRPEETFGHAGATRIKCACPERLANSSPEDPEVPISRIRPECSRGLEEIDLFAVDGDWDQLEQQLWSFCVADAVSEFV